MKLKITLLVTSILMIPIGYLLLRSYSLFGVCVGQAILQPGGETECYPTFAELGWILQHAGLYLTFVAMLLLATSKRIFNKWKKFAIWFVPFAIIIIILQPEVPDPFEPLEVGKSIATIWSGTVFLIISASIILFSNLPKYRKK